MQLTDPIIKLEDTENLTLCLSAGNNILKTPFRESEQADHKSSTSTFFLFFFFFFFNLKKMIIMYQCLKKNKEKSGTIHCIILVVIVTILKHSTLSWNDENVRMRIGRSNGSGWVHLYWHRPFKRYKLVLWDGGVCGQNRRKKKSPQNCAHWPNVSPLSEDTVLFHHLKLAVKSTVVPNI